MDKIFIIQRETLDWQTLDLEKFKYESIDFCKKWGKPDDFAYDLAKLWNNTFGYSYFKTRARLKIISENHNANISGTEFIPYSKNRTIPLDGAAYVFVDDDDWFSPDISSVLLPHITKNDQFLLWRATNIGSPNLSSPIFYFGLDGRCMTNNYMVSGGWVRQQGSVINAFSHSSAVRTLRDARNIEQLDNCLSVSNKGPISSVSLDRGLGISREPFKLRDMLKAYLHRMSATDTNDIEHIKWIEPVLRQTVKVYQDVYDA